ncbi:MAG TPA: hypothetical protein VFO54_11765 [Chryseosolibacter sp.]|nr:hypothetical protein [Chryseosolibacter sp.]
MKKNDALGVLAFLVGNWRMKIYNASFLASPSEEIMGKVFVEWFEDETFITMRSEAVENGPPGSVAVLNLDDTNGQGAMLYYDSRGVSRIYNMSFADNIWKLWRDAPAPGFNQKFEGVVSNNGNTIIAAWYAMENDTWRHDFSVQYEKLP